MKRNIIVSIDEGWANGSWRVLEESGEVEVCRNLFIGYGWFSSFIVKISRTPKLKRAPFKYLQLLFIKRTAKTLNLNKIDDICILVYHISGGSSLTVLYKALKKEYPNIRISYVFTNVVSKCFSLKEEKYYMDRIKNSFDKVYAFDRIDQKRFEIDFAYLVYNPVLKLSDSIRYDVFLVAKAKDRLDKIMKVYQDLSNAGLIIEFYVNEISQEEYEIVKNEDIHANQILKYEVVVEKIQQSKCIVDVMQQGSTGVTLNVCEAVVFGKKIISDNINLMHEPFYDPRMIYIIGTREDSIGEFVQAPNVGYNSDAKELFSGTALFDRLRLN